MRPELEAYVRLVGWQPDDGVRVKCQSTKCGTAAKWMKEIDYAVPVHPYGTLSVITRLCDICVVSFIEKLSAA